MGVETDETGGVIEGGTDGTPIGNVGDRLKVSTSDVDDGTFISPVRGLSDAFSRLRTSNPLTLFEYEFKYDHNVLLYFHFTQSGTGVNSHDGDAVSHKMDTGIDINSECIIMSHRRVEYNKGKSQLWLMTGHFNTPIAGLRQRYGCFDSENGLFFEVNGTTVNVVRRSKTSGSVVDTAVAQASWNLDTMDGDDDAANPSGLTLDVSKQNIIVIDYSWLGSGIVRWGFLIDGSFIYVHQENYSNTLTTSWSQSGQLPMRAEIKNITAQAAGRVMRTTCGSVVSEGGAVVQGKIRVGDTGLSSINLSTTPVHLYAMRLDNNYMYSSAHLESFNILASSGNSEIYYRVIFDPVIVGGTWASVADSAVEELTGLTSFSGGRVIDTGYATVGKAEDKNSLDNDVFLGFKIDSTANVILFEGRTISSTAKVFMSVKRREFV